MDLSTMIPRLIGAVASSIVGYALEHWHVTLDPATITAIMLGFYTVVHQLVTKIKEK